MLQFRGIDVNELIDGPQLEIVPPIGHGDPINAVAISPNGKFVLSGSADGMLLWDLASGRVLRAFRSHDVTAVAFTAGGQQALSGERGQVSLWDLSSGKMLRTFPAHNEFPITAIALSPDESTIVATSGGGGLSVRQIVTVWDSRSGEVRSAKEYDWPNLAIDDPVIAIAPDGKSVLSGKQTGAWLSDLASGKSIKFYSHPADRFVRFLPDGNAVLLGGDTHSYSASQSAVHVVDLSTGRVIRQFAEKTSALSSTPDGRFVVTDDGSKIQVWEVASGSPISSLEMPRDGSPSRLAALAPDISTLALVDLEGQSDPGGYPANKSEISVWDLNSNKILHLLTAKSRPVDALVWSPEDKAIFALVNGTVEMWSTESWRPMPLCGSQKSPVDAFNVISNGNRLFCLIGKRNVEIWDIATRTRVTGFTTSQPINAVSADGRLAASSNCCAADDITLTIYELTRGQVIRRFSVARIAKQRSKPKPGSLDSLFQNTINLSNGVAYTFLPDNRTLMVVLSGDYASDNAFWDAQSGRPLKQFPKPQLATRPLAFLSLHASTINHMVAFQGGDGIQLFDLSSGRITHHFGQDYKSSDFSPDGRLIAGIDGSSVHVWDTESGALVKTFETTGGDIRSVAFSPDGGRLITGGSDGTMRIWTIATGELLASLANFLDGEWVAVTAEGFFDSSENGAKLLNVVRGTEVYSIDQFYQKLYSPDLVHQKLVGDPQGLVRKAAQALTLMKAANTGSPPQVRITNTSTSYDANGDYAEVRVEITNQGGGLGTVEWRVNDKLYGSDPAPTDTDGADVITRTKRLPLWPGENRISVAAYNAHDVIESEPRQVNINAPQHQSSTPARLFILAVGVNGYATVRPQLHFAVSDAVSVHDALALGGGKLYQVPDVKPMVDADVTAAKLQGKISELSKEVRPDDIFVLYLAGHGKTVDNIFYFLPQDFDYKDDNSFARNGISQTTLMQWLSNINARQRVLLIDSCESGSAISDTSLDLLLQMSNIWIMTASKGDQNAAEGKDNHGYFTYSLLKAFGDAQAHAGGRIDVLAIMSYVHNLLPELASDNKQTPLVRDRGEDFDLVVKTPILKSNSP